MRYLDLPLVTRPLPCHRHWSPATGHRLETFPSQFTYIVETASSPHPASSR